MINRQNLTKYGWLIGIAVGIILFTINYTHTPNPIVIVNNKDTHSIEISNPIVPQIQPTPTMTKNVTKNGTQYSIGVGDYSSMGEHLSGNAGGSSQSLLKQP